MTSAPTVLKLGGELLEDAAHLAAVARTIAAAAAQIPLVVVHGGGREIDAALARAGIEKRQVEGIRITDDATLQVVVPVLAGAINTRFVAAIGAAGGRAVGLTGADYSVAPVTPMAPLRTTDGRIVPLGFVGQPSTDQEPALLAALVGSGYIPVVASIGCDGAGALYNVNADTMAAAVAIRLGAGRLVVAGTTPGVLDDDGANIPALAQDLESRLVAGRAINAGMVAKLRACREALAGGVPDVTIADGRDAAGLLAALRSPAGARGAATLIV